MDQFDAPTSPPACPALSNRVRATRHVTWTPHADSRLVAMRSHGASLRAMAAAFGLSRGSIALRAGRLNLPTPAKPANTPRPAAGDAADPTREALPAGHPLTWGLLTAGTCLEGAAYEIPRLGRSPRAPTNVNDAATR